MSIYTKTGDSGITSLYGSIRLPKSERIFDVLGNIDELNSWLGFLLSLSNFTLEARTEILKIQSDLLLLGACLSTNNDDLNGKSSFSSYHKFEHRTLDLEKQIDDIESQVPELHNFVLPGCGVASSACHIARTVCRRLERGFVELYFGNSKTLEINLAYKYLNRLSDFLFQLARLLNKLEGFEDMVWRR